jgi:hypothetical protein
LKLITPKRAKAIDLAIEIALDHDLTGQLDIEALEELQNDPQFRALVAQVPER